MLGIIGKKVNQSQKFLEDGTRVPVTQISTQGNVVVSLKTSDKDKYNAVQVGFGIRKNSKRSLLGHSKKAGLDKPARFLREIRVWNADEVMPEVGSQVKAEDVLKPGDIVNVTGKSKGKGYAGVVKRHHFKGGPRTHGQSDRERAPGSIGQTTTPGRVYKGKRMAGRMGNATATLQNLTIIDVTGDEVLIKGLVPGPLNGLVIIRKIGESKKFVPLWREQSEAAAESLSEESKITTEEAPKIETADEALKAEEKPEDEAREEVKTASQETPAEEAKEDTEQKEEKADRVEEKKEEENAS